MDLYKTLLYEGIHADVMTADRPQPQRDRIVQKVRVGAIWVLITTDLMARGMDFKGVKCVINLDFPQSVSQYIHRIGRTGRAGHEGTAVTFFTEEDSENLRMIAHVVRQSGCDVPDWMLSLPKQEKSRKRRLEEHPPERESLVVGRRSTAGKKRRKEKKREEEKEEEEEKGEEREEEGEVESG